MSITVVVPTYNGGTLFKQCIDALLIQKVADLEILIIDSGSNDGTVEYLLKNKLKVIQICKADFNHGGTRNLAVNHAKNSDYLVFLTQDCILDDELSIYNLIELFQDASVSAICGRQIPHADANPLAKHARLCSYPAFSAIKSQADIAKLGIKTGFMSNSFSAYRRNAFEALGGFPKNTILAEDMFMASKMILSGYKIAYCAEAVARHSHNYTPWEEFRRYFDIGVFHVCEPWIQQQFGGASGEGFRFAKSELYYLWPRAPLWIPRALLTTACKLLGYKLGKSYLKIPRSWRPYFSMYKSYWLQQGK